MQNGQQQTQQKGNGIIRCFEDLLAWSEARALTREIYSAPALGQLKLDTGLRDQVRRASVSVMSNLAEGFERAGLKEKVHFMNIARASCAEVESLLYICLDNHYLTSQVVSELQSRCTQVSRLTSGFIRALSGKNTEH
jgi:four helix bundle protein